MVEVGVAGSEEFLLGFKLSGVRHTYNTEKSPRETLEDAMREESVGVLVVDEGTMKELPSHFQKEIMNSTAPVVLELSDEVDNSRLRNKITRAIGVDLWEKGDNDE